MGLIIKSKIAAIRSGKESSVTLHFIAVDADGNHRMDVVHPNKDFNPSRHRVGQEVELEVAPIWNRKTDQIEFTMLDDSIENHFAVTNGAGHGESVTRQ